MTLSLSHTLSLSTWRRAAQWISDVFAASSRAPRGAIAVLAMAACSLGYAADLKITAEFKVSALNPTDGSFKNTTAWGGHCAAWNCPSGMFSISLPIDYVEYGEISPNAADADSISFRFPSELVDVPVVNKANGHSATIRFRVSHFAARYQKGLGLPPHEILWVGGSWIFAPFPCGTGNAIGAGGATDFSFLWTTPPAAKTQACVKKPKYVLPAKAFSLTNLAIQYEMVTPSPLTMNNGTYVGTKTFTVGPNGDFSFGNLAESSAPSVDVSFELTVKHEFQVSIPDSSRRAFLEPPSGWQNWANGGAPPTALKRDLEFLVSQGAPFTVALKCASANVGRCNLSNPAGSRAPYSVMLTIPGMVSAAGKPVSRLELTTYEAANVAPAGSGFVSNARGRIHVEADGAGVQEMLKHPGTRYDDAFTLSFDAQTN